MLLSGFSAFAQDSTEYVPITAESPKEYIKGKVIYQIPNEFGDAIYNVQLRNDEVIEHYPYGYKLPIGSTIILEYYPDQDSYFFVTIDRNIPIMFLVVLFITAVLFLAGRKGVRSLLALFTSFLLLFLVYVPLLLSGNDALWITVVFGLTVLALSIFITHGYNKQSLTSLIGSGSAIICAAILVFLISKAAGVSGIIDEHIQQLAYQLGDMINLTRLVSAGIIIGIIGVLDDITITQVAVVRELSSDKELTKGNIFVKALRVGRDHVASLVNTLVFAYVGASLPMIMVISLVDIPFSVLISQEFIFVEIMRSLIGALALILAVPVTTWLATFIFFKGITKDSYAIESSCAHHH